MSIGSRLRGAYRALVPTRIRAGVRARLPRPEPPKAESVDEGPRRFVLSLPVPVGVESASGTGRETVVIEVPRRRFVTRHLQGGGLSAYEPSTAAVMLGVAETIRPPVVFDIGANVGPHAWLIPAVLDVPVVAFEPAADVAADLRHIVEMNGLRCTVEELALGEQDEMAQLFISPTDTSTSLRSGFREATGETSVQVRTVDSFVRTSGLVPTLLKVDTETTEPAVFRGATALLERRPWIVCEVLPEWTEADIESLLLPLGYLAFHITDDWPLVRSDRVLGHTSREHTNWLFAPEAPSDALWAAVGRWRAAIDASPPPRELPAE